MSKYDFIIIGAGIGGLHLGNFLEKNNKSYLIIESQQRLGGRINTYNVDGVSFELGAARILSNHKKVFNIIDKLGLEIEEQNLSDSPVYWENKWYKSVNEIIDWNKYVSPFTLFEELLNENSIVDLDSFHALAPEEWDKISTKTWLERNNIPFNFAKLFFLGDIDVNLQQITLYESLFFYLINLFHQDGKTYRLKSGMHEIIEKLEIGLNVLKGQNVNQVEKLQNGFNVFTNDYLINCSQVIFTCSLSALNKIDLPERAKINLTEWLNIGHYGSSLKGYFKLKTKPFPNHNNLISDIPLRMIRRSDYLWEFYLPSLNKSWDNLAIEQKLKEYFGDSNLEVLKIQNYTDAPYFGCYWNYKTGNFHKIFNAAKTNGIDEGIYSVGEHFSLNPNWMEGSLESVDRLITELFAIENKSINYN